MDMVTSDLQNEKMSETRDKAHKMATVGQYRDKIVLALLGKIHQSVTRKENTTPKMHQSAARKENITVSKINNDAQQKIMHGGVEGIPRSYNLDKFTSFAYRVYHMIQSKDNSSNQSSDPEELSVSKRRHWRNKYNLFRFVRPRSDFRFNHGRITVDPIYYFMGLGKK